MPHRLDRAVVERDLRRRRSRTAPPRAMAAVDEYLVRREDGLVLLFTPPFDHTPLDPGYIKGYPPGIRENGGQYTHAALWSVIAFAMLGDGDKAGELFSMLNPINHARHARRDPSLQGRAVRRVRRPLLDAAACRARRMDLVHGLGGMDVSRGPRVDIGLPVARQDAADRSVHPEQVAGLRDQLSIRHRRATKSRSKIPRGVSRGVDQRGARRQGCSPQAPRKSRSPTTARRIE